MGIAIVIGVGPNAGLGAQIAKRFARLGKTVFVAGRTLEKIEIIASEIRADGGEATAVAADATVEAQVIALFDQASEAGTIDVAVYNAGNNTAGRIIDMEADYFEQSWRVCCFGGFLFGREALRRMVPNKTGVVLFTGASASLRGRSNFGAFNSSKGALRNLAQAMAKEYGADGIHVGHIVVDGAVGGEKIKTKWPEYAEKLGEAGMINIQAIVDGYEFLYKQPPGGWSFEIDMRTAIENW